MRTERVEFFSEGLRLRGFLHLPDGEIATPLPAIVRGPGWLGLAEAKGDIPWHEGLTAAGYALLIFDYRGLGDSEGERGWFRPDWQLEDILNAVTYLESRPDIDRHRIGSFGMGGTGGGNAIMAAAVDPRIRCVVAQSVVADGADWLHRMRREYEWVAFKERVAEDRSRWVATGTGEKVHPRQEIMIETPERQLLNPKRDVDARMPAEFFLRSADLLMRYRPIDFVHRISPRALLITSVVDDVVTPEDHATALYERAGPPKRIVRQADTTHYRSYDENLRELLREMIDWYDEHLAYSSIQAREAALPELHADVSRLQEPS